MISRDEMEPNISVTTEENKDAKPSTDNEIVTTNSAVNSEEGVKEEAKETDLTIVKFPEIPSSIESSYIFIIDPPFCTSDYKGIRTLKL